MKGRDTERSRISMEETKKNHNQKYNKSGNYYHKKRTRPQGSVQKTGENQNQRFVSHTKTIKVKKLSEETVSDIVRDIERLEKEIDLEIKGIQSTKLSF